MSQEQILFKTGFGVINSATRVDVYGCVKSSKEYSKQQPQSAVESHNGRVEKHHLTASPCP
eukprot:3925018-Amphidinium_carterae.1